MPLRRKRCCRLWGACWSAPRSLVTSGGAGTMGFGLPAAIGAKLAAGGTRMSLITRRAAAGAVAGLLARPALAQARFPDRPIRLVVPFTAGGTTDVQMRALCEAAGRRLGQPVIVENRGGAGGTMGAQALLHEKPDGYFLATMPVTAIRYPLMQAKPAWNPLTDFTWIVQCTGYLFGVVVRADAPWKTFEELLTYAKANPGVIAYGTPGVGGSLHLTMEDIAQRRGIEWLHVPFRGVAENTQALLGGQIQVTSDSSGWSELVDSGKLRLLVEQLGVVAVHLGLVDRRVDLGQQLFGLVAGQAGVGAAVAVHEVYPRTTVVPLGNRYRHAVRGSYICLNFVVHFILHSL
jgi:hypothetical protein